MLLLLYNRSSELLYFWQSVSQYVLVSSTFVALTTRHYFLSECCSLKFAILFLRPSVREGAPKKQDRKFQTITFRQEVMPGHKCHKGVRYQDILTDWLTVSRKVTSTLTCPVTEVSSFQETQQSRCHIPLTWGRKQIEFLKRFVF
jgi:hypothetical protein